MNEREPVPPARSPLLKQKASTPLLQSAKNTRETTLREVTPKVRDEYMLCWVSLFSRFSHFLLFLSLLGAFYKRCGSSIRLQTIEQLRAALASSPALNPFPPPISSYVAVAALLPCYETSEHAALLCFPLFLFSFSSLPHPAARNEL